MENTIAVKPFYPRDWQIHALFLLFPVWWVLGVDAFIWPLLMLPLGLILLRRFKDINIPGVFVLWGFFLLWVALSATMLTDSPATRELAFAWRASLYISATILFLYFYNVENILSVGHAVVWSLFGYWCFISLGGVASIIFPNLSFESPAAYFLPDWLVSNEFVQHAIVKRRFSETSSFLGYAVPRPIIGFPYTNIWGSVFALLVPFVIAACLLCRKLWQRGLLVGLLALSVVPLVFSMNRGAWLSLAVGLLYAMLRLLQAGRLKALRYALLPMALIAAAILFTPLGDMVVDRLATPHSNRARAAIYTEVVEKVLESPVFGWGTPRASSQENLPSLGTHGQFWLVLFSQGIPGLVFFMSWLIYLAITTRNAPSPIGFWCHIVLVIGISQIFFYHLTGTGLNVMFVAAAVALREQQQRFK